MIDFMNILFTGRNNNYFITTSKKFISVGDKNKFNKRADSGCMRSIVLFNNYEYQEQRKYHARNIIIEIGDNNTGFWRRLFEKRIKQTFF